MNFQKRLINMLYFLFGGASLLAGVSTACFYPKPLEDSLYQLALNGIHNCEIFINTHSEINRAFALGLRDTMSHFDAHCISVHPFTCELEPIMLFSDYPRRVDDTIDYYKHFFEFMNIVGAKMFILHGAKGSPNFSRDLFCERYMMLSDAAAKFGVTVTLENVNRCLSGSLKFVKDIRSILGSSLSFTLDTKQALRAKENPFDFVKALGSSLKHLHISDSGELGDCLPIGKGRFNFQKFITDVYSVSPDASLIIELYKNSFCGISDLLSSYNIIDNFISKVSM